MRCLHLFREAVVILSATKNTEAMRRAIHSTLLRAQAGKRKKTYRLNCSLSSRPPSSLAGAVFFSFFRCLETTNKKKHPLRVNLEWIVDSARTRKADQDVCEKRHSEPDLINAPPSDIKENLRRFVKSFTSLFSWFGIHSPLPSPFQFRIAP